MSDKRLLPVLLLFLLLPGLGIHRFYVGKVGTGILYLVTCSGLGIWWIVDLILIVSGNFTDSDGNRITEWT